MTDKKQVKKSEEAEEIENLKKMKSQIVKKSMEINQNSTQDLLKIGNSRLIQIESEKTKLVESEKHGGLWSKIFKCGFCCPKDDDYHHMN